MTVLNHTRDEYVDRIRGIAMIHVLLVHALFWCDLFVSPVEMTVKSLLLIEMPVFFFVTGASARLSSGKGYLNFTGRRLQGIFLPYCIYALICILLSAAYSAFFLKDPLSIPRLLLSWCIPCSECMTPLPFLTWALWFIPVYAACIFFIPFLLKAAEGSKKNSLPAVPLALTAFYLLSGFLSLDFIRNVCFYLIWIYAGCLYPELKKLHAETKSASRPVLLLSAAGIIILLILHFFAGYGFDMQFNKFPPNIMFLFWLCHNKQLINSHFYRGVSELPYKLLFAVIYTHLEFRYEVSHTITSHHVHHFHQTRIPDGTLLDDMVQYRKPLFPQFFLYPKKFLPENNPHHKEFHLRPYIQNNANQQFCFSNLPIQYGSMLYIPS